MTIALHTNIVSPHQLPLARELVRRVGEDCFRYIYTEPLHGERSSMGWQEDQESWILDARKYPEAARVWLENADVVYSGFREMELFAFRGERGKITYYFSERWFKPVLLRFGVRLPGEVRMFAPNYRKMANSMVSLINNFSCLKYFAMGIHAHDDLKSIGLREDKIVPWGYFVETSGVRRLSCNVQYTCRNPLRILWVGRMIVWKRVETLIRAIAWIRKHPSLDCTEESLSLTLVGNGPRRFDLQRMVRRLGLENRITFMDSQPIMAVRDLMRSHHLYVLTSDENEGWGAVVNEALEEGMGVLGTFEAGASATILPKERLFHAGDHVALARLIQCVVKGKLPACTIGEWSAEQAAERFLKLSS